MYEWMGVCKDGWMDEYMYGGMEMGDGQMDGLMMDG